MKKLGPGFLPQVPGDASPSSILRWASRLTTALRTNFNANSSRLSATPEWGGFVTPAVWTGRADDYAPSTAEMLRIDTGTAARNLTGMGNVGPGVTRVIVNVGAYDISVRDESSNSLPQHRIRTATGSAVPITPGEMALFIYDDVSERWRIVGK